MIARARDDELPIRTPGHVVKVDVAAVEVPGPCSVRQAPERNLRCALGTERQTITVRADCQRHMAQKRTPHTARRIRRDCPYGSPPKGRIGFPGLDRALVISRKEPSAAGSEHQSMDTRSVG